MKIELSKEALDIIITELEISDQRCNWELGCCPDWHKNAEGSDAFKYWTERQKTIKKALKELRGK